MVGWGVDDFWTRCLELAMRLYASSTSLDELSRDDLRSYGSTHLVEYVASSLICRSGLACKYLIAIACKLGHCLTSRIVNLTNQNDLIRHPSPQTMAICLRLPLARPLSMDYSASLIKIRESINNRSKQKTTQPGIISYYIFLRIYEEQNDI